MEPQYPNNRQLFYAFCKVHLNARPEGGFITDQAARRLFEYVKECMSKLPSGSFEDVTMAALNKFPYRRIDLDILEMYELVPRNPDYATCATGDEYKYKKILAEAIIEGVPKVLIDWVPTWKPTGNVPKSHLKAYREKTHGKRKTPTRGNRIASNAQRLQLCSHARRLRL